MTTAYINTGLASDPAKAVDQDLVPGDLVLWVLLTAHDYNANNSKHDRGFAIQCYVRACSRPTINLSVCSIRAAAVTWRQARQST